MDQAVSLASVMWVTQASKWSINRRSNQPIWTFLSSNTHSQLTARWLGMLGLGFKALLEREGMDHQWQWWIWLAWRTWLQLKTPWLICGKPTRVILCINSRCNSNMGLVSTEGKLSRDRQSLLLRNIATWYKEEVQSPRKLTTLKGTLMWTSVVSSSSAAAISVDMVLWTQTT